ncbi:MAG: ImmA/IrrE family metallo-endopeptidase [Nitrospiraceae bacterium]|nr:ImmA/IrrE family metallo-endopeptidase [Nitrospiraceae bacterium]MDA8209718.1 ImmA/IrrE family metallo-endopeptidase [Actinomycetota bacterium]
MSSTSWGTPCSSTTQRLPWTIGAVGLWDQNVEDEAQWLAGAPLLTEDAALSIARSGTSLAAAAMHFGISEQVVTYRLNVTGARKRVARARTFRVVR